MAGRPNHSRCSDVLSLLHPPRVLFVDDDSRLARAFEIVLNKRGMEMMGVRDVRRALTEYVRHVPECAVVDWRFPGSRINGLQVLTEMAERIPKGRRILFTGFAEDLPESQYDDGIVQHLVSKSPEGTARVLDLIQRLTDEWRGSIAWQAMAAALADAAAKRKPVRTAVRDLISHLCCDLSRAWREADMGSAIGVGPRHLRRIVSEDLGVSPAQLRDRHRAAAAQIFLRNRDLKVSTVAPRVGLSSARSLRRLLQRQTSQTQREHHR